MLVLWITCILITYDITSWYCDINSYYMSCHSYSFCHSLKWIHAKATVDYMKKKTFREIKTSSLYERFIRHVVDIKSSRRRFRVVSRLLFNHQYQEHTAIRKRSRKCFKIIVFSRRIRIVWKLTKRRINKWLRFKL